MKSILALFISVSISVGAFSQEAQTHPVKMIQSIKTVSEIVQPEPVIDGAPKHSDVCFSPRWPTTRPGGIPLDVAPMFHTTRLEWVYLTVLGSISNSSSFVQKAHEMGYLVCGTVNSILPDKTDGSPITYTIGRARDLENDYISFSWLPGTNTGCTNNPDYKSLWLSHARQQTDIGADNLQMDDPGMNGNSYLCYCEYCVQGFSQYLEQTLSPQEMTDLNIPADTAFDYRQYSIRIRDDAGFALTQEQQSKILLQYYKEFQTLSTYNFFVDVHEQLDAYTGRTTLYSCNSSNLFIKEMNKIYQMGMFETYPHNEGNPGSLYLSRILPMRDLGKSFIGTFVSSDIPLTRRYISQMYAFGKHVIVPWDVYMGSNLPRLYASPADYADLYGFVRANSEWLDNYWEAAVAGEDLNETRYGERPPVHLLGGSLQVRATVRAQAGNLDAPVVIHLVEWADEPEPFTVVIDPDRFFGDRPVRVTLSTPPAYKLSTHQDAENSGNYSKLSVDTVVAEGRLTNIEIPELSPWGLVKIEPLSEPDSTLWQPMMWMESDSYFTRSMQVHLSSPTEGIMIRYTLNGDEPTEQSSLYTSPLTIDKTSTIRACAFDSIGNISPESRATFTYVGKEIYLAPDTSQLAANLKLWLRADALGSQLQDGQPVNSWLASAGPAAVLQSVKLYTGNISEPPVFRKNAINGRPAVSFEEASHHLGIENFSNQYLAGKQFTIFMVSRSDDNYFGFSGNSLNGGGGTPRLYLTRNGMSYNILDNIATGAAVSQACICSYSYDGETLLTWTDGKPGGTRPQAEPMASFGGGHFAIPFWAGNNPHLGQMAEIIIYNRSLSDDERMGVESYLSDKYAFHNIPVWKVTPANLPTSINLEATSPGFLQIYPNPGNGRYLNIELSNTGDKEIFVKIYDLKGTELINRKTTITNSACHIPISPGLLPGIYIILIIENETTHSRKFLVSP